MIPVNVQKMQDLKLSKITVFMLLCSYTKVISYCHNENGKDKYGQCTKRSKDFDNEKRILLAGKTGVGKSSTGNAILGFKAFETNPLAPSVTRQTQYNKAERFGKRLVVVDTPGLFDTGLTEKEVNNEISKWYSLLSPGIHAVLLVVKVGRFTDEEQKAVDSLMNIFGDDLRDYLIVIFTHKNLLEEENMTVGQFVQSLDKSSNLRKLIDAIKGRYIAIGYKGKEEDRVQEVKEILSMIEEIGGKDGENYYSNEVFESAQKQMEENEKHRKKTEKIYSETDFEMFRSEIKEIINNNNGQNVMSNLKVALDIVESLVSIHKGMGKKTLKLKYVEKLFGGNSKRRAIMN